MASNTIVGQSASLPPLLQVRSPQSPQSSQQQAMPLASIIGARARVCVHVCVGGGDFAFARHVGRAGARTTLCMHFHVCTFTHTFLMTPSSPFFFLRVAFGSTGMKVHMGLSVQRVSAQVPLVETSSTALAGASRFQDFAVRARVRVGGGSKGANGVGGCSLQTCTGAPIHTHTQIHAHAHTK